MKSIKKNWTVQHEFSQVESAIKNHMLSQGLVEITFNLWNTQPRETISICDKKRKTTATTKTPVTFSWKVMNHQCEEKMASKKLDTKKLNDHQNAGLSWGILKKTWAYAKLDISNYIVWVNQRYIIYYRSTFWYIIAELPFNFTKLRWGIFTKLIWDTIWFQTKFWKWCFVVN